MSLHIEAWSLIIPVSPIHVVAKLVLVPFDQTRSTETKVRQPLQRCLNLVLFHGMKKVVNSHVTVQCMDCNLTVGYKQINANKDYLTSRHCYANQFMKSLPNVFTVGIVGDLLQILFPKYDLI